MLKLLLVELSLFAKPLYHAFGIGKPEAIGFQAKLIGEDDQRGRRLDPLPQCGSAFLSQLIHLFVWPYGVLLDDVIANKPLLLKTGQCWINLCMADRVLATCGIRPPDKAFENPQSCLLLLADPQ